MGGGTNKLGEQIAKVLETDEKNDKGLERNAQDCRGKWGQLRQGYSETSLAEGNPIGNPQSSWL